MGVAQSKCCDSTADSRSKKHEIVYVNGEPVEGKGSDASASTTTSGSAFATASDNSPGSEGSGNGDRVTVMTTYKTLTKSRGRDNDIQGKPGEYRSMLEKPSPFHQMEFLGNVECGSKRMFTKRVYLCESGWDAKCRAGEKRSLEWDGDSVDRRDPHANVELARKQIDDSYGLLKNVTKITTTDTLFNFGERIVYRKKFVVPRSGLYGPGPDGDNGGDVVVYASCPQDLIDGDLIEAGFENCLKYPAVLYTHGGGGFAGSAQCVNETCAHIACSSHCIVYNIEYRLAPETYYPHGPFSDMYAVLKYIHAQAAVHKQAAASRASGSGKVHDQTLGGHVHEHHKRGRHDSVIEAFKQRMGMSANTDAVNSNDSDNVNDNDPPHATLPHRARTTIHLTRAEKKQQDESSGDEKPEKVSKMIHEHADFDFCEFVDTSRICLMGESGGGMVVMSTAALLASKKEGHLVKFIMPLWPQMLYHIVKYDDYLAGGEDVRPAPPPVLVSHCSKSAQREEEDDEKRKSHTPWMLSRKETLEIRKIAKTEGRLGTVNYYHQKCTVPGFWGYKNMRFPWLVSCMIMGWDGVKSDYDPMTGEERVREDVAVKVREFVKQRNVRVFPELMSDEMIKHHFPPTVFVTSEWCFFIESARPMMERLQKNGKLLECVVYPGGNHVSGIVPFTKMEKLFERDRKLLLREYLCK